MGTIIILWFVFRIMFCLRDKRNLHNLRTLSLMLTRNIIWYLGEFNTFTAVSLYQNSVFFKFRVNLLIRLIEMFIHTDFAECLLRFIVNVISPAINRYIKMDNENYKLLSIICNVIFYGPNWVL